EVARLDSRTLELDGEAASEARGETGGPGTEIYKTYVSGSEQEYPVDRTPIVRALYGVSSTVDDMEVHRPNKIVPVQVWGAPIFDSSGHVAFALSAFRDISDRRAAEQALMSAADRYRIVTERT